MQNQDGPSCRRQLCFQDLRNAALWYRGGIEEIFNHLIDSDSSDSSDSSDEDDEAEFLSDLAVIAQ